MNMRQLTPEQIRLRDRLLGDNDNSIIKSKFKSVDESMDKLNSKYRSENVESLQNQVNIRVIISGEIKVADGPLITMIRHDIEQCIAENLITNEAEGAKKLEEYRKMLTDELMKFHDDPNSAIDPANQVENTNSQKSKKELSALMTKKLETSLQGKIADLNLPLRGKLQESIDKDVNVRLEQAKNQYRQTYQNLIGQKRFATLRLMRHGAILKLQETKLSKLGMTPEQIQEFKQELRALPPTNSSRSSKVSISEKGQDKRDSVKAIEEAPRRQTLK